MQPVLGNEWALVGRERQLRTIEKAAGQVAGIVLCGQAGVGKTRLSDEVLARFSAMGRPIERVAATRAAAAIPLGAVSHLMPAEGGLGQDKLSVLRGVADRFADADPVIIVDDVHLLDDASTAVIHHLALRSRAFLVMTLRAGEPCPDAVTTLWKDEKVVRLDLPPLPTDAVDSLLDQTFRGRLDGASKQRLARLSAGNPLLLSETLRAGLDTGALRRSQGIWHWNGPVRPTARLVDLVASRFGSVGKPAAKVLELVACGEPLPLALLEKLAEPDAIADAEQ
ncbi:AAA family ATPase, partial [Kibdelosporangium aridum]|uniref:AAA family ATPase n=1 Tax=Kibdelosporangium aridum TaxID=2030 RepID=UPI0037BED1B6